MLSEAFTVGMLYTNCYVASCQKTKEAIVIDPGLDFPQEAPPIFDYIEKNGLKIRFIVNTHGHDDHIKGDALFIQRFNIPVCIHSQDAHCLENLQINQAPEKITLQDGGCIEFGAQSLKVLHTPGHTPGSVCLVGDKLVFTGDTLFAGSIGRTDFEEGSPKDMAASLQKLKRLPDSLLVYAGHGETTLLGHEKKFNPFLTGAYSLF